VELRGLNPQCVMAGRRERGKRDRARLANAAALWPLRWPEIRSFRGTRFLALVQVGITAPHRLLV
jgi:hypothetical protein